eukprot:TRINITY_DN208_c0_g1_i1.p1 TRINITY_DN208_c0_g1~~TRINITY_DN208_c0_g1_i1.p1  ORF type:complete len:833 (+),score=90.44 TRINITY_DN208_c0_g1_i1:5078-7576(+)
MFSNSSAGIPFLIYIANRKVTGSVSTRTSYLIAGNVLEDGRKVETSSKYKKAVQLKTPILAETDLEDLLQKATKNPNFTLVQAKAFLQGKETEVKETKPAEEIIKEKAEADGNKLWADKYAPESTTEIVGNTATINKLKEWIHDWEKVVLEGQKKPIVFRPGMSRDNIVNVNARACLLSGPPGIGKSTAAVLCAKEEGYDVVETNASDHRNKKIIEQLLSDAVGNEAITMYSSESDRKKLKIGKKTIVVMDEVDGVSGNNDRGGIQALIKIIKTTKTPIICICNDRQSQKVRSLANHCYDLKFIRFLLLSFQNSNRPQNATIKNRLKIILSAEKVHMDDNALELLIESAGNDIRQMINMLQLHSSTQKSTTFLQAKDQLRFISKDAESMVNPFEAATKLLNQRESREFRMNKKMSLYFIDFELMPLLVQENYLTSYGQNQTLKDVQDMAESADYISLGDCMNRTLREENEWTLLPDVGLCSTIAPTTISARIPVFVRFPTWFGKNSTIKKTKRLIHELANAMAGKVSVPQDALLNDIIPYLLSETVKKLMDGEAEEAIAILNEFRITLDMFKENVLDLCENTKWENKYKNLDPHTKSAFTRVYHKLHPDIVTKKKKKKGDEEEIKDKIDPDIESVKDAMEKSEEAEEEEEEEIVIVPTKSTKGTKARKKETKKATGEKKARTPKKESKKRAGKKGKGTKEKEENLPGFIVEDEEEQFWLKYRSLLSPLIETWHKVIIAHQSFSLTSSDLPHIVLDSFYFLHTPYQLQSTHISIFACLPSIKLHQTPLGQFCYFLATPQGFPQSSYLQHIFWEQLQFFFQTRYFLNKADRFSL